MGFLIYWWGVIHTSASSYNMHTTRLEQSSKLYFAFCLLALSLLHSTFVDPNAVPECFFVDKYDPCCFDTLYIAFFEEHLC